MSVDYLVLGIVLVIMGAVQTWLRHGAVKEAAAGAATGSSDASATAGAGADGTPEDEAGDDETDETWDAPGRPDPATARADQRSGKAWGAWTAILGPLGMALGVALIVLGALGR